MAYRHHFSCAILALPPIPLYIYIAIYGGRNLLVGAHLARTHIMDFCWTKKYPQKMMASSARGHVSVARPLAQKHHKATTYPRQKPTSTIANVYFLWSFYPKHVESQSNKEGPPTVGAPKMSHLSSQNILPFSTKWPDVIFSRRYCQYISKGCVIS